MSVTSGFFNSINGDRTYNADDLTNFFDGVLDDGIFKGYGGSFALVGGGGTLNINIMPGKAIVKGKYVLNNSNLTLPITAGGTQPRYDAVVIGVDLEQRTGDIYIKQGTPGASPAYPTLLNNTNTKELCLGYVYVAAGATSVDTNDITDTRADESVCGYCKFTNISANLKVLRNNVPVTANNTNNVVIGISQFDETTDTLFVYLNGSLMVQGTDYMIRGTGSTASIDLAQKITDASNNNIFTFVVFKMEI